MAFFDSPDEMVRTQAGQISRQDAENAAIAEEIGEMAREFLRSLRELGGSKRHGLGLWYTGERGTYIDDDARFFRYYERSGGTQEPPKSFEHYRPGMTRSLAYERGKLREAMAVELRERARQQALKGR